MDHSIVFGHERVDFQISQILNDPRMRMAVPVVFTNRNQGELRIGLRRKEKSELVCEP